MIRSLSATAKLGALLVLVLAGLFFSSPSPQTAEAASLSEVKKLTASDAQANDFFSRDTGAINGDTIVVGAQNEDGGAGDPISNAGAAYIFQRDQGGTDNWGEVKKLTASDAQADADFGRTVAVDSDTAIVGAPRDNTGATEAGAAYVFQRDQGGLGNWGEVKKLTSPVPSFCDFFGIHVAVSGDTAIVGEFVPCGGFGAAYVFERDEGGAGNWGEVKKLTASDAQFNDSFGDGVTLSGDTAVVSASLEDEAANAAGAAYVFEAQNTPTGTDVEVAVGSGVIITFPTVTTAGDTTVTTSTAGPEPPTGFRVMELQGQPIYYDINTSASFTGTVTVCIEYDETQLQNENQEENLTLRNFDTNLNITQPPVDTANNVICGKTTSFSIFAVLEPLPLAVGGDLRPIDPAGLPLETPESSSSFGLLAWAIAAGAGALAFGSAGWYVRKRLVG